MATVPKGPSVKQMVGLPTREQLLTSPQHTDKVQAVVQDTSGTPLGPAKLTEGEIVFSIPAIIAIGQGNYEKGKQILTQTQERLRVAGEAMMEGMQQNDQVR